MFARTVDCWVILMLIQEWHAALQQSQALMYREWSCRMPVNCCSKNFSQWTLCLVLLCQRLEWWQCCFHAASMHETRSVLSQTASLAYEMWAVMVFLVSYLLGQLLLRRDLSTRLYGTNTLKSKLTGLKVVWSWNGISCYFSIWVDINSFRDACFSPAERIWWSGTATLSELLLLIAIFLMLYSHLSDAIFIDMMVSQDGMMRRLHPCEIQLQSLLWSSDKSLTVRRVSKAKLSCSSPSNVNVIASLFSGIDLPTVQHGHHCHML